MPSTDDHKGLRDDYGSFANVPSSLPELTSALSRALARLILNSATQEKEPNVD